MPLLVFVYFTQFLDKNILSYASIMDFPVTGIWYNDVAQAFCKFWSLFARTKLTHGCTILTSELL